MRIWSLHPKYLDTKGLVALWRESLLAQKVLLDNTKGYRNHPQLLRFKSQEYPVKCIANYLHYVWKESQILNYNFDKTKIFICNKLSYKINVNSEQIQYEWQHLLKKLSIRDQKKFLLLKDIQNIETHPIFQKINGKIEDWEKL